MMNKIVKKIFAGTLAIGLMVMAKVTLAAEMVGLAEFRATSSAWITDNTGGIIQAWMVWAFAGLGISIVFILIAKGQWGVKNGMGGGRRRRR